MSILRRILTWISSLKVAIFLLFLIALASAIGTAIPQSQNPESYLKGYEEEPWLGFISGQIVLLLQLDHVYSSNWFLGLLAWLGFALMICSWRRQWPILQAAMRWTDYQDPKQISKLAIAETINVKQTKEALESLTIYLEKEGWEVKKQQGRIAARKGVIGRVGPPLIHLGLVLLMFGAAWGAVGGQQLERFLTAGSSLDLLNPNGLQEATLTLQKFEIERDPAGRPEQFRSNIQLTELNKDKTALRETSVNHPIRFQGITIYQADWSLAGITLQVGQSPPLRLPLRAFPELGDQIWGLVLPTKADGGDPILLSVSNENGPIKIFDNDGTLLTSLTPRGEAQKIKGVEVKAIEILPASGLLIKHDPGVPIVYSAFAITLIGGGLSILSTSQLWAITDKAKTALHIGGLCNRNLFGLVNELPNLIRVLSDQ